MVFSRNGMSVSRDTNLLDGLYSFAFIAGQIIAFILTVFSYLVLFVESVLNVFYSTHFEPHSHWYLSLNIFPTLELTPYYTPDYKHTTEGLSSLW